MAFILMSCGFANSDKHKMMEAKEVINMINKGQPVQISDKIITGDLDFTQIKDKSVGTDISLVHNISQNVIFVKCVFMGKVIANREEGMVNDYVNFDHNISFVNCDFRNDFCMDDIEVNGNISFAKSVFRGNNTSLNNIKVKGKAQFWEVVSEKNFTMVSAHIWDNANFMDAQFQSECSLQNLICNDLQFSNVKCGGPFDFSLSTINGNLTMNYCEYDGDVQLSNSRFSGTSDILDSKFMKQTNFEKSLFLGKTRLSGSEFKGEVNTNETLFLMPPALDNVKASNSAKIKVNTSYEIETNKEKQ
jgi:hypothetical protein